MFAYFNMVIGVYFNVIVQLFHWLCQNVCKDGRSCSDCQYRPIGAARFCILVIYYLGKNLRIYNVHLLI